MTTKAKNLRSRKKEFKHHVSPMDHSDGRSGVYNSEFRGLYNLALICGLFYTIITPTSNFLLKGVAYKDELFTSVFFTWQFIELIMIFLFQAIFSFTALIPVMLYRKLSTFTFNFIHHSLQSILFIGTVSCIFWKEWNTIHSLTAFVECLVLLMKMHSYIRTSVELIKNEDSKHSISIINYFKYLLYPTLVYEPEYPRNECIRWSYVCEKVVEVGVAIWMMYFIVTEHVVPVLEITGTADPFYSVLHLLLPFIGCYLLVWFIVFECICNGIAELTYFADRDFYDDWWNSTTFDEYARRWNKPVHEFLLRHVYLESLETYKISRQSASLLTFGLSAALHECIFVIIFRTIRMYFFILQLFQVVLIIYGRGLKGTRLGNMIFWTGMILGPPMQAVLYCREYHGGSSLFMVIMAPTMILSIVSVFFTSLYKQKWVTDKKH